MGTFEGDGAAKSDRIYCMHYTLYCKYNAALINGAIFSLIMPLYISAVLYGYLMTNLFY